MSYSISLNNFKKVAAVATFLATAACLIPDSAQAIRISGDPNCDSFSFTLENSVNSANILNPVFTHFKNQQGDNCKEPIFFNFKPAKLTDSSPIDHTDMSSFSLLNNFNKFEGGKKYTANLSGYETASDAPVYLTLYFFVSPSKSDSIKNFLDLSEFLQGQKSGVNDEFVGGIVFSGDYGEPVFDIRNNFQAFGSSFKVIPEPSATVSLLGIGALGAALALKRRKYLQ